MKIAVRYFSKSGNSKKLAEAAAQAAGCEALDITAPLTEKVDVLFLCSALYAGDVDASVKNFISANAGRIGSICSISSAAAKKTALKAVKKAAATVGVTVMDEEFFCNGSFLFMHKGRPNAEDCKAAAEFVSNLIKE